MLASHRIAPSPNQSARLCCLLHQQSIESLTSILITTQSTGLRDRLSSAPGDTDRRRRLLVVSSGVACGGGKEDTHHIQSNPSNPAPPGATTADSTGEMKEDQQHAQQAPRPDAVDAGNGSGNGNGNGQSHQMLAALESWFLEQGGVLNKVCVYVYVYVYVYVVSCNRTIDRPEVE